MLFAHKNASIASCDKNNDMNCKEAHTQMHLCQHDMENVCECQTVHKLYNCHYKMIKQAWHCTEQGACI